MDTRYLNSVLFEVVFYFLNIKETILNKEKFLSFDLQINKQIQNSLYIDLIIFKGKKDLLKSFRLPAISNEHKEQYILEVNLFLINLYKNIKIYISDGGEKYLHICPECFDIHSNNSMYLARNYLCNKCILGDEFLNKSKIDKGCAGYIYFFESKLTKLIKIGFSGNPRKRKKQIESLQGGEINVLNVVMGPQRFERYLHERFEHLRAKGEWFYSTNEIVDFIKSITNFDKLKEILSRE